MSPKTTEDVRQIIQDMVDKLVAEYQPEKIILFGSHAHGEPDSGSDIDLLIVKDTSERYIDRCCTVRGILSDRKRKIGIDTIVVTPDELSGRIAIGDQFVNQILTKGCVLHEKTGDMP